MDRSLLEAFGRRVRLGMVGGGADSVIGGTHLIAMRADGLCELAAGAMSIDPQVAQASGRRELLAPDRIYTDWRQMLEQEAARPDGIDAVSSPRRRGCTSRSPRRSWSAASTSSAKSR